MALNNLSLSERIRARGHQCVHPYIYYRNGERHVVSCGKLQSYYLNTNVVPATRGLSDAGRTLAPLLIK